MTTSDIVPASQPARRRMNLIFTAHAEGRLRKRWLERAWVERVVESPERAEPDPTDAELEHRYGVVPELANRC